MRLVLLALAFLASIPGDADACSCVERSFAEHAKSEQRVFLARAGKPVKTGDALEQTFTVLATFKGTAQAQFKHDRPATPPCASSYAEGEVAILFTTRGDLDPCHGNVALAAQASSLPAILDATGTKRVPAKAAVVEAALRDVLAKYTHDRPQITVIHAPLAGGSFTIGKSKLVFAKSGTAKDVRLAHAFTAGTVSFVDGTYGTEGLRFTALVHDGKVAWSSVAER